ncbi:MarR family transcriptional regulator [Pseudomonas sp. F1_0610]|uniref:MarR family winged helix-turn-helix transcriptional regulator n=1 Tax=Pseudomonas sp. F1_0610 TaxID=3114284 RepID=UPI0039C45EC3
MSFDKRYIFLLSNAHKSLQRYLDRQIEASQLSAVQAGVLFVLEKQQGLLIGELAQRLNLAPSAMTGLADRMIKLKLISRQVDAQDKRSQRVYLTDQGLQASKQAQQLLVPINQQLTKGFSAEEMQVVSRWLQHIQRNF